MVVSLFLFGRFNDRAGFIFHRTTALVPSGWLVAHWRLSSGEEIFNKTRAAGEFLWFNDVEGICDC
jgi:hypothetical protein